MKNKFKISNIIFFSYLGLIFLISIGVLIYFRTIISDKDLKQNNFENLSLNNRDYRQISEFKYVYLKNVEEANMVQKQDYAVDIPEQSMVLRNDTLFVENCNSVNIEFKNLVLIQADRAVVNLEAFSGDGLDIICQNSEINLAALSLEMLNLTSNGNSEINLSASKVVTMNVNFNGKNEVNIVSIIGNMIGNNSNETEITITPKPKNVDLTGRVFVN